MGVNSLITWAVIDPVMRALITEMRVLTFASCCWSNTETRVSTLASWCCSDAETRVLTLASWCCSDGYVSLAPVVWILLSNDLSSKIFRQPTEPPPKFLIFRGWLGRISKYFRLWLNSYFSWLDWQSLEILCAWSCLDYGLCKCTVKPFEVTRGDPGECLDTQSRLLQCFELVVGVLLNQG